jgi:hypothetical protein
VAARGTGTIFNFGSLGGDTSDIRLFPPRSLSLKGVEMSSWLRLSPEQRRGDVAVALRLADRELYSKLPSATRHRGSTEVVAHVDRSGRAGVVFIDFSKGRRLEA